VISVSSWFLLKKRHLELAKKSIVIAAIFGLTTSIMTVLTGDHSARLVAEKQPMKFAAMEGLYKGQEGAGLIALGVFSSSKSDPDNENLKDFAFKIEVPNILSYMAFLDWNAFVPGIDDLISGNEERGIPPVTEKVRRGRMAIDALKEYKEATKAGNDSVAEASLLTLNENFKYFGYGYFVNDRDRLVPNVPLSFYSFHIMVGFGMWFVIFFMVVLLFIWRDQLQNRKMWLRLGIANIAFAFIASQAGWVLAEVGRQPWVIQDIMPTMAAVSQIDSNSVVITFCMFAVLFTILMIAEIKIMLKQIKIGPKEGGH
jgi:cytochrome d ubiquinol oxidase subunit I